MKIIKIKKRKWYERIFSINHWKVTVLMDDGREKSFNCWANVRYPNSDSLLWHLREQLSSEKEILGLIGKEL